VVETSAEDRLCPSIEHPKEFVADADQENPKTQTLVVCLNSGEHSLAWQIEMVKYYEMTQKRKTDREDAPVEPQPLRLPRNAIERLNIGQSFAEYDPALLDPQIYVRCCRLVNMRPEKADSNRRRY
jgi:hypothetical protein